MKKFITKCCALWIVLIVDIMCKENNDVQPPLSKNNYPSPQVVDGTYPSSYEIEKDLSVLTINGSTLDSIRSGPQVDGDALENSISQTPSTSLITLEEFYSLLGQNLEVEYYPTGGGDIYTKENKDNPSIPIGFKAIKKSDIIDLKGKYLLNYTFFLDKKLSNFPENGKLYLIAMKKISGNASLAVQYMENNKTTFPIEESSTTDTWKIVFFSKKRIESLRGVYNSDPVENKNIIYSIKPNDPSDCKVQLILYEYQESFTGEYWQNTAYHKHYDQKTHPVKSRRNTICGLVDLMFAYRNSYAEIYVRSEVIEGLHEKFLSYSNYKTNGNFASTRDINTFVNKEQLQGKFLKSYIYTCAKKESKYIYRQEFKDWIPDQFINGRFIIIPVKTKGATQPFTGAEATVGHFIFGCGLLTTANGSGSLFIYKNSYGPNGNTFLALYSDVLDGNFYNNPDINVTTLFGYGAVSIGKQ